MGKRGGPVSRQGAEANDFTHFLVQSELPALRERLVGIRWDSLVACGESLVSMLSVLKAYKGQVPLEQRHVFVNAFKRYSQVGKMINQPFVPKKTLDRTRMDRKTLSLRRHYSTSESE